MNSGDTIIACSTRLSPSPRAIVRLSGPDVPRLARTIACETIVPRHATCGVVNVGSSLEIPVLCVLFVAPASYTGQDVLELALPGNPVLVERVIGALISTGDAVRRAEPGEFSARAFLHGKLTLEQAEGVAGVIAARTGEQLDAAARLLRGTTGARYRAWCDELLTLLALVEAGIDFTDQEDVVAISASDLAGRARAIDNAIAAELGAARGSTSERSQPVVLLVGAPNAGKSTLFNALLGRRRAVESPIPGTTRDVLREELDLGAHVSGAGRVELCDSAGLDGSIVAGASDAAGQSATREAIADADVIVHCDPAGVFAECSGASEAPHVLRVRTKCDRASPPAPVMARPGDRHVTAADIIPVCALDGWNMGALRRAIADASGVGGVGGLAVARHAEAMRATRAALAGVIDRAGLAGGQGAGLASAETMAESLRSALDAIGAVSGRASTEDILAKVFSAFCVGK